MLETTDLPDQSYSGAIRVLTATRSRLAVKSPCEANPSLWDGIDFEESVPLEQEAARVQQALAFCSYCPVLDQCEGVLMAALDSPVMPTSGVIAGVWLDNTPEGGYIDYYLENGQWPEGIDPRQP